MRGARESLILTTSNDKFQLLNNQAGYQFGGLSSFLFFSPRKVSRISINGALYVTYQRMITDTLHLLHDKDCVEDNEKK